MFANKSRNRMTLALSMAMLFVLACSISVGGTAPTAQLAFDPTKMALEFQATQMAIQLTQVALSQPTQGQQPVAPATQPLVVATDVPPTATPDLTARMKSAKILVYENMDERNIGMWISDALDNLGLTYTNTGSYSGHFMEFLNSGTIYDLIIVGAEDKDIISGEFWDVINTRLNRDNAALIAEIWYLDREANGPINKIMSKCGISYQKDYQLAESTYWWVPTHPIFNEPNTVLPLIHYSRFWANQTGDKIRLNGSGDAVLLAGVQVQPQNQEGVMAVCMQGRVVFQTFSTHDYKEGDMVPLWENYIYNTLKAHFAAVP